MKNSRKNNFTGLGQHLFKADFERGSVNTAQMNGVAQWHYSYQESSETTAITNLL